MYEQPHQYDTCRLLVMAIVVVGATCSLGEAVIDKLLSMDVDVVAFEESHKIRNASLLKYSGATLSKKGDGYSISFDGSPADIIVGKDLLIHDLIPTRNDRWMPDEFRGWLFGKNCENRPRYWLSVIDAANAIAHLVLSGKHFTDLHMCGRREWSYKDTKAEFEMLWKRTNQGQTGKFTAETLFGHDIAGMEPKPIRMDSYSRPNLDPLHNELLQLTGDGWRPLIPLRTAIMTLIAGILE